MPEAASRDVDSTPGEVFEGNRQPLPRMQQDKVSKAVSEIPKEKAREIFEAVKQNVGYFSEFRMALSHVQQGELPHMWLSADIRGYPETRLLLTDRRLLLFRVRLVRTPRLQSIDNYDLGLLCSSPLTTQLGEETRVELSFSGAEPTLLVLGGLSPMLAEQLKGFLVLTAAERAIMAREGARAGHSQQDAESTNRSEIDSFFADLGDRLMSAVVWVSPVHFGDRTPTLAPKHGWRKSAVSGLVTFITVTIPSWFPEGSFGVAIVWWLFVRLESGCHRSCNWVQEVGDEVHSCLDSDSGDPSRNRSLSVL